MHAEFTLANRFLASLTPAQKNSGSTKEAIDVLVSGFVAGQGAGASAEIYTRMTNSEPPSEVYLVVFSDESTLGFRRAKPKKAGSAAQAGLVVPDTQPTNLISAVTAARQMYDTTRDPAHVYRNSDGVEVVVQVPPPKATTKATKATKAPKAPKATKDGGKSRRNKLRRSSNSTRHRKRRLSRNRK